MIKNAFLCKSKENNYTSFSWSVLINKQKIENVQRRKERNDIFSILCKIKLIHKDIIYVIYDNYL